MPTAIPESWEPFPPHSLVVGGGPVAKALTLIFEAATLDHESLVAGPTPSDGGKFPNVLNELTRVFVVTDSKMSASDHLSYFEAIWNWVERLSKEGPEQRLSFIHVLPSSASSAFESSLATGMALDCLDPVSNANGVWRPAQSLSELLLVLGTLVPKDLVFFNGRRRADKRRIALAVLKIAGITGSVSEMVAAATEVRRVFADSEYDLDMFCSQPCHSNGNRLGTILRLLVTTGVTQEVTETLRGEIPSLLR